MKYWKNPKDEHIVYEAFTAVADGRIQKVDEGKYKCFSSTGDKFYTIYFKKENQKYSFASDDNMAFYRKEFSYPMLAVLLMEKTILVDGVILNYFKNIFWKEINTKNKNDYMKSVGEVLESLQGKGVDILEIKKIVEVIFKEICATKFSICKI